MNKNFISGFLLTSRKKKQGNLFNSNLLSLITLIYYYNSNIDIDYDNASHFENINSIFQNNPILCICNQYYDTANDFYDSSCSYTHDNYTPSHRLDHYENIHSILLNNRILHNHISNSFSLNFAIEDYRFFHPLHHFMCTEQYRVNRIQLIFCITLKVGNKEILVLLFLLLHFKSCGHLTLLLSFIVWSQKLRLWLH